MPQILKILNYQQLVKFIYLSLYYIYGREAGLRGPINHYLAEGLEHYFCFGDHCVKELTAIAM